jgi:DNA repair protein RadA/Sms
VAKLRVVFRCTECGASSPRWAGRCSSCEAWNCLVEEVEEARPSAVAASASLSSGAPAIPITEVDMAQGSPLPTGVDELDRVLGGGLVPGSVTLLGGEPGIGKSTLLLDVAARRAAGGATVLYVSGEESPAQVRARAERLGALCPSLLLQAETDLAHIVATIERDGPDVVVVDSIQTLADPELGSAPGSVVQVRECAHRLVRVAKEHAVAMVLVGHVTKDGGLAGPRVLEHVVDTVLSFEGDRHHALRLLRAVKHRFGSTSELGLFEMRDAGLVAVPDPSGLFLADRRLGVPGSAVVPLIEGRRPLLVEVQSLVARSELPNPRRNAQGLDQGRLAMLLAVLQQRVGCSTAGADVYVSTVGGVRLGEAGSDLAVCLALVSAVSRTPVPDDLVACGEVGLGGELRQAAQTPRRLHEAARLGFRRAIVSASAPNGVPGIEVLRAANLAEALDHASLSTVCSSGTRSARD